MSTDTPKPETAGPREIVTLYEESTGTEAKLESSMEANFRERGFMSYDQFVESHQGKSPADFRAEQEAMGDDTEDEPDSEPDSDEAASDEG